MARNEMFIELVQNRNGGYYANVTRNGKYVQGIKEYVDYRTLAKSIKEVTGFEILKHKDLVWMSAFGKKYAYIQNYMEGSPVMTYVDGELVQV